MCLSTVYKGETADIENMIAEYVVAIDFVGESIHFTGITGEETTVRGSISHIDMTKGLVFVTSNNS